MSGVSKVACWVPITREWLDDQRRQREDLEFWILTGREKVNPSLSIWPRWSAIDTLTTIAVEARDRVTHAVNAMRGIRCEETE